MSQRPTCKPLNFEVQPDQCFWESEMYCKSYFLTKDKGFRYYDNSKVFKYLFYHWLYKWIYTLSKHYIEPYQYHPLPVSDQILLCQTIFSKYVSDGLVRLDAYETSKSQPGKKKIKKPYKSILFRALILTFWKRLVFLSLGLIIVNVLSMSIAILVKKFLKLLKDRSISYVNSIFLLLLIIVFQILDGLLLENINFYILRLICVVHYLCFIGIFQHGLCYRRKYYNNINGYNLLNVCNQVLHSCSPDSECSKNPLYCQALRYQNKDHNPQIFNFEFNDSFYVSQSFESVKYIIEFLTNFSYGIFLLSFQINVNIWVLYVYGVIFLLLIIIVEIISTITLNFILYLRDYRVSKSNNIILALSLVKKMLYDDIAINIITESRNNELSLFFIRMFLTLFNITLYNIWINITFFMIQKYFITSVKKANVITEIDVAGFMTSFYIYMKIINSMFLIPKSLRSIAKSYVSFKRMGVFINECSPNFYISDNKCTGSTQLHSNINSSTNQLPNDVIVYYRDATFTWVNTRSDLLNKNYEPYLKSINFELKRGEIAIVTGSQGSGKSNFIKSMLGEMTLVGGSMAVVPLHTSMPIFYASQDIFLQQGTIRSNITFGYKFNEHLYNSVLKAVELEYDISTWEKGDLRVVSDNAHSLSGGQRVRMEMARAIYAYLIFHKVNVEYNNSKCSFLMCLDGSFQGLDPYVSKTIFNNLFNVKTGLLIKDDLSVVLTASKQSLDICSKTSDFSQYPDCPIYNLKDGSLRLYSNLHSFIKNIKNNGGYTHSRSPKNHYYINYLTNDMLNLCSSGCNSRAGRIEITKLKYMKSFTTFIKDEMNGVKFNSYKVYMSPALGLFIFFITTNIALTIMDHIKLVFSSRLSDYISKHIKDYENGAFVDLDAVKSRAKFSLKITTMFVSIIIVLSFMSTIFFSLGSITSSRKLHEYCINSIFNNSSSVIKVKKQISQLITFVSCDTIVVDDGMGLFLSLLLIYLINTLINLITLFYLIPVSIPFVFISLILISHFVLLKYVNSSKNINFAYLESTVHINFALESSIMGSSIYRSFKKESELVNNAIEHRDYKARCKYLLYSVVSWSSITFNWAFSITTLITLTVLISLDKFSNYKLRVGYFGLALSLCVSVTKTFSRLSSNYSKLEMFMCSIKRFRYFIPPGQKLIFDEFLNIHKEYIVDPRNNGANRFDRNKLLSRRAIEFKVDNKKLYGLRKLFYNPKIIILDVGRYLTHNHYGIELRDVCAYTSPLRNKESMILKHFNVYSRRSEIIGLVGRTGAGKTTLLSVLQNTIGNRTGQVLLDGKDLNDIPKVVLRQIIGVLPQLPFVFKGWTIRRFLDPRKLFADDEINKSLNQCGLLNFVNNLPGGKKLDTVLVPDDVCLNDTKPINSRPRAYEKERSMSLELIKTDFKIDMLLSNTQLRTLSLARLVLYRNFFRLIIVDEPPEEDLMDETSAINDDLGVPIYDLLTKYFSHCTTFVTAHNVNILKTCTSVWVIHNGHLTMKFNSSDIAANESIANIIEESLN